MIVLSIVHHGVWKKLAPHLRIDHYDRDGSAREPRIRIGFVGLPERFARELVMITMPCVSCQRPSHPLRRREGDGWDRLYYGPACPVAIRPGCSKGRAAMLEYARFAGMEPPTPAQLALL